MRRATQALRLARIDDPERPLHVADDYLRGLGFALLAWVWSRSARVASPRAGDAGIDDKLRAMRFGIDWVLPEGRWRRAQVMAPSAALPPITG